MKKIPEIQNNQNNIYLENLYKWLDNLNDEYLPSEEMMKIIGSPDKQHFINVIKQIFSDLYFISSCTESSKIVDLGCGCGRMALPFTQIITNGHYYGYDVWEDGINWCRNSISKLNNNFNFIQLNTENNYYFNEYNEKINKFKFLDIENNSVDFIFAISVFTHLNPDDTLQYFNEFNRILKNGQKAYITSFIIDEQFFDFVKETGFHSEVKEKEKGFYSAYSKQHYLGGYTMELWNELLEKANLKIIGYEPGSWARKKEAKRYQDTFIIQKN